MKFRSTLLISFFFALTSQAANISSSYFICESSAGSANTSTLTLSSTNLHVCETPTSCIDYTVQNCFVSQVEGPWNKVQLNGSCQHHTGENQVITFQFTPGTPGLLTNLHSRVGNSAFTLINNNLECRVVSTQQVAKR